MEQLKHMFDDNTISGGRISSIQCKKEQLMEVIMMLKDYGAVISRVDQLGDDQSVIICDAYRPVFKFDTIGDIKISYCEPFEMK